MLGLTFTINTSQFESAVRQYLKVTKHALAEVINHKAFFIARRAVIETPKANKQKFVKQLNSRAHIADKILGQKVRISKSGIIKRGKMITEKVYGAPLAALIINARRGRKGEKGIFGRMMAEALTALIASRGRSVAFIKSGWLGAIKTLERVVRDQAGAPRMEYRGARQVGVTKGGATPAVPGMTVRATIENSASGPHETNDALVRWGLPGLQRAFDFETASTMREVAKRMYEEGKRIGIKIMGG